MLDLLEELKRIQSMDTTEGFNRATDSLQAIALAVGAGPSVGLWMFGRCAAAMAPSTTIIVTDNLGTHLPDDVFNNQFYMQVLHNFDAPGIAPEREIRRITDFVGATQTFTTDAFSANLGPGDLVAIIHESVLSVEILGFGTLTVDSTTVPADGNRAALYAWENDNYFNGCLLMPTEGLCRFQPRRIVDFTRVGGIFTLDPNNPFSQLPGTVDYIIIGDQTEFIPAVDGANNRIPSDVIGGKTDTAIAVPDNVSSIIRYLKGILTAANEKPEWGTPTPDTHTTTGTTEETILETAYTDPFRLWMYIDLVNMVALDDFTFKVYTRIDGANFRLKSEQQLIGAQTLDVYEIEGLYGDTACDIRITVQRASGADRAFPFRYNVLKEP